MIVIVAQKRTNSNKEQDDMYSLNFFLEQNKPQLNLRIVIMNSS